MPSPPARQRPAGRHHQGPHRGHGPRSGRLGAAYGSDLRILTGLGGIPTVQYGPGDVAQMHSPDEHVSLTEVATAARTLTALALSHCEAH